MLCSKLRPFDLNNTPALFYDGVVFFFLPKCVFFYQWCLSCFSSQQYVSVIFVIMFFITTVCFCDFCKTVLVKKYTPCQGMIWFSLSNVTSLHWLLCGSVTTQLKPHLASEKHEKTARGRCPRTPAGAYVPDNLFLLRVLPQKCNKVTLAFSYL